MTNQTLSPWAENSYPLPYKNCLVLGHVCDEKGFKMSKSKGNYLDPWKILDNEGADALRWYFYSSNQPWTSVRFFESAIRDAQKDFLVRLRNVYSFFVIYANIDEFDPSVGIKNDVREFTIDAFTKAENFVPLAQRSLLDKWMMSHLETAAQTVTENLQAMNILNAAQTLNALVDALSNWFVRRSRDRFWQSEKNAEKWAAYWTLYETLARIAGMIAPFTPFMAEEIYQRLFRDLFPNLPESIHLTKWREYDETRVNHAVEKQMDAVRTIASLGLSARAARKLKVRQPLNKATIITLDAKNLDTVKPLESIIKDELNVKDLEYIGFDLSKLSNKKWSQEDDEYANECQKQIEKYCNYEVKLNFKTAGQRYGKDVQAVATVVGNFSPLYIIIQLYQYSKIEFIMFDHDGRDNPAIQGTRLENGRISLTPEDLVIRIKAKDGFAVQSDDKGLFAVIIDEKITPELARECLAREIVNRIQNIRKELDLPYQARIKLSINAPTEIAAAIGEHKNYIIQETLVTELITPFRELEIIREFIIDEHTITISLIIET